MDLSTQFKNLGYLVVPNFITQEKVMLLRNISEILLDQENDSTLKPTTLLKQTQLTDIIFNKSFIDVLNNLNPEYRYFLPNFTVRRDLYIGWHTDDEYVEQDEEEAPGVLQCNIYLQDNSGQNGGGIDVVPGTHLLSQSGKKDYITNDPATYDTVKTQAGDLLIFDYRAIHRSSIATGIPQTQARMALQWTVCKSPDRANMFMQYLIRRQREKLHLSDYTDKRALSYFYDAVNVLYPDSFDKLTQNAIAQSNIMIPSFFEKEEMQ